MPNRTNHQRTSKKIHYWINAYYALCDQDATFDRILDLRRHTINDNSFRGTGVVAGQAVGFAKTAVSVYNATTPVPRKVSFLD